MNWRMKDFHFAVHYSSFYSVLFSRIKSGNPGYLVAFNTAERDVVANLTVVGNVSGELTVVIRSSNIKNPDIDVK